MTVNIQREIRIVNKCNALFDDAELIKAILWYAKKPVVSVKNVYMHGKYPGLSIGREKIHLHRLLMMYWSGRILERKEHVHHCNHNKLDARKENLSVIDSAIHMSKHNKNKKLSKEHRKKISLAGKKRAGIKIKRKYNIKKRELKEYLSKGLSIRKISQIYGCDWSVVKQRVKENPELLEQSND